MTAKAMSTLASPTTALHNSTMWWEEPIGFDEVEGKEGETNAVLESWSTGPGNEEEVHLFDVEPGLYYITAYSFRNA